jgi:leucyl-tRNA synthetase
LAAKKVCEDAHIKNQEDRVKLESAKEQTYKLGFARGVMIVGPYSGQAVASVKPVIQKELVDRKDAILYSEPEGKVVSRSGDECVCALTDQWYMKYGETEWRVRFCVEVDYLLSISRML